MKKTIVILTATRAEYGLLRPIIRTLSACTKFNVRVVVTGAHLSAEFGLTYKEIENDGIRIDRKIEILLSSDTSSAISKNMGLAMISFADYFADVVPDYLMVLGDRYETLAVCCAAMNARIPIIHLYGGETTQGAVDEAIRHAITKMSYLHLASTEEHRHRIIQLGENPSRVFNVGAVGIENALHTPLLSKAELEDSLHFSLGPEYALITFHPVTLEGFQAGVQVQSILKAIESFPNIKFIITKANADAGGRIINQLFEAYSLNHKNIKIFDSLGMLRYLSAIKYSSMVIGNSSSGLVEVPSFKVPTINIGDRQRGRIMAKSIINCEPNAEEIIRAINFARSSDFRKTLESVKNPYGDGNTTNKILKILEEKLLADKINLKKEFYDIDF